MALDIPVTVFEFMAGHDGSEIVFPGLPEPQCRRGFHVSEAVLVAMQLGYSATPFELFPMIAPSEGASVPFVVHYGHQQTPEYNWNVFDGLIHNHQGVIEVRTQLNRWHAVAFCKGEIFDPDGRTFPYSREACAARGLFTTRLWRVEKIQ